MTENIFVNKIAVRVSCGNFFIIRVMNPEISVSISIEDVLKVYINR